MMQDLQKHCVSKADMSSIFQSHTQLLEQAFYISGFSVCFCSSVLNCKTGLM